MLSAKMVVLKIGKPEKGFETLSKFMAMSNMSNAIKNDLFAIENL